MQEIFTSEEGGLQGYEDILVAGRNQNWIPIMREMMNQESVFFAVGAGHLGGIKGVIHLLRLEGYSLRPFQFKQI